MTSLHSGSCRCGLIGVEARRDPFWVSYCHCRDCRRQTGAPVSVFVGFREDEVTWQGAPTSWRAGGVTRSFCASCGSQISYRDEKLPGDIYLYLGFMDHPENYPPRLHAFDQRRLPFLHIEDGLPREDGFSIDR